MKYRSAEEYLRDWPHGISGGKGEGTAKAQLALQNKLQQQAFDLMQQRQTQVNSAVGKYLSGDVGFDPAQLATMKSQFLNQVAGNYNQGAKNVMTALARRGSISSAQPVGGDYARGIASLEGAQASDTASGLANIDLSNLQQAITNKFNAASLINGQSAQLTSPIATFGSGASNALNQYVQAANSGFGATFMHGLGGTIGQGLGTIATGGIGALGNWGANQLGVSGTPFGH